MFLKAMQSFLPYFVEFEENDKILSKEYLNNCVIGSLDWQPIIMITYDESIFFANDSCWKIWISKSYNIFCPKRKDKSIIVSNIFFS